MANLLDRLAANGSESPMALVLEAIAYLPERDFWLRQVMAGVAPSEWMIACERVAELLNEGVEPGLAADAVELETKHEPSDLEVTA